MANRQDRVEIKAEHYCARFGSRARQHLSIDLSRAIGSHDWDQAYVLHCADLRLIQMEESGLFDPTPIAVAA